MTETKQLSIPVRIQILPRWRRLLLAPRLALKIWRLGHLSPFMSIRLAWAASAWTAKVSRAAAVLLAMTLPACAFLGNGDIRVPVECLGISDQTALVSCLTYGKAEACRRCKDAACLELLLCPIASPTPVSSEAPSPRATPAPSPTSTQTPTPTAEPGPSWTVTLAKVKGFGHCNPYPCDPRTPDCADVRRPDGSQAYPIRTQCEGDRTFHFVMPGFDLVPSCAGQPNCPRDDRQSPCGGSPACDGDHMGCPRVRYGCQGKSHDDPRGSILSWNGGVTCREDNGYRFRCDGTPGATYLICARPYTDPREHDGTPIVVAGTGQDCASGFF